MYTYELKFYSGFDNYYEDINNTNQYYSGYSKIETRDALRSQIQTCSDRLKKELESVDCIKKWEFCIESLTMIKFSTNKVIEEEELFSLRERLEKAVKGF